MNRQLLHHEIVREIGRGGMGVVYEARDTRLGRPVAIKVLLPDRVADPERKRRFIQEARAASALNHPNIITVHDINSDDGVDFIVMEHVDGKPLDELIPSKGLRASLALKYAIQIADALAMAHNAGILHRDVKPSNLMVTTEGRVKVLDFGLAKLTDRSESSPDAATLSAHPVTGEGMVMGTAPYMSPEQAEGQKLDARSDIFSFGSVLYEMITGQKPFTGDSPLSMVAKILSEDPKPVRQLVPSIPPDLAKIVSQCLRKDPARRYQHMADVKVALEDVQEESASGPQAPVARTLFRRRWVWVPLLSILLVGGVFTWRQLRVHDAFEPLRVVPLTTFPGEETYPTLSPDGKQVAFAWSGPKQDNFDIYVQLIGSGDPLRLTSDPATDYSPAWSPDGRWIAFLRGERLGNSELLLVPPLGGQERRLAEIQGREGGISPPYLAWSPDGQSLIVTDSPGQDKPSALFVISAETGEKRPLTHPEPPLLGDTMPAVSPDGRSLAFVRIPSSVGGELHWLALGQGLTAAGTPRKLTQASMNAEHPTWTPDGQEILFSAQGTLWRVGVSGTRPAVRLPFVGEGASMPTLPRSQRDKVVRLVYVRSSFDVNIWRLDTPAPGWPASSSQVVSFSSTQGDYNPAFSPNGRRVAFGSHRSGRSEIWLADLDASNAVKLTSMNAARTGTPGWSPDGQTIAFDSNLEGQYEIYTIPASGGKPRPLTSHPANDAIPSFSRDGKWIYFSSNRSGAHQIWKVPSSGGDAVQVTHNGGYVAFESTDGVHVYYTQTSNTPSILWRISTRGGEPVKVLEGVIRRAFTILETGVYYMEATEHKAALPMPSTPGGASVTGDAGRLRFFDFAAGTSRDVADLGAGIGQGLTASPDGRTVLFSRIDSSINDLMMVENFR